jgi:alginate O-acetyltransferase complex protein AlgI
MGIIFSMPAWGFLVRQAEKVRQYTPERWQGVALGAGLAARLVFAIVLLLVSASWLASGTYNPFIYFRF